LAVQSFAVEPASVLTHGGGVTIEQGRGTSRY